MKVVGEIYSTMDYSSFKKLEGNRDVLQARKNTIMESISEIGWIRNPIVVNEKMEIIDGQGRYEALKELQMPIEYVVAEGAKISHCIALNIKQKNWSVADYVYSYANMGSTDYVLLASLLKKFPNLNDSCVYMLAGKVASDGAPTKKIKSGEFEMFDLPTVWERFIFTNKCMGEIGNGMGALRVWCSAFKFVYFCKSVDNDVFLEKLHKNRAFIVPCATIKQALELLEKIYNRNSHKGKVYFVPEFEKWRASIY